MFSALLRWLQDRARPGRRNTTGARPLRPQVEDLEGRQVPTSFGNPAHLVENTQVYPLDAVCRLEITFPKGPLRLGSGALIDKNHVLTAAHNLYRPDLGGYATRIAVIPAERLQYGTSGDILTPFGTAYKTRVRVAPGWFAGNKFNYDADLGLITLNKSFPNSLGYAALPPGNLTGLGMNTAGYPGNGSVYGFQMYSAFARLENGGWTAHQIYFRDLDTSAGQSGAPIWVNTGAHHENYIVALISHENAKFNYATRITPAEVELIKGWLHADAARRR